MFEAFSMMVVGAFRNHVNPLWVIVGVLVLMALLPSREHDEDQDDDDGDHE